MSDKAVDKYYFVFEFIPDRYKAQEMCEKVFEDPFLYDIVLINKICVMKLIMIL